MSERAPTTDQLRHAIDSGATGEKVDHPDPAAVPLGTDDEAAGFTPSVQERRMAAAAAPQAPAPAKSYAGVIMAIMLFIAAAAVVSLALYLGLR